MEFAPDFINMVSSLLPGEDYIRLLNAINGPAATSIRLNTKFNIGIDEVLCSLECGCDGEIPWASNAYYLDRRPSFTLDPLLHQGMYYVQEASSMFLEQAFRLCADRPVTVLDLCAAPGGKSTLLSSLMPEGSILVSNEIQRGRAQILAENMAKWGNGRVLVTCNSPKEIGECGPRYDIISVDAPCSGEGMFRKEEQAVAEWSLSNVEMCASRQRSILKDIWPALRPGGFLIYSTCTFNTRENEENVRWMTDEFGAELLDIPTEASWNIMGALDGSGLPVYHFMQHRNRGEGFFLSLLRKPEERIFSASSRCVRKYIKNDCNIANDWLSAPEEWRLIRDGNRIFALPCDTADEMLEISDGLYTLIRGIDVAVIKGKDVIPAHGLAMSDIVRTDAFNCVEMDRMESLAYLRCEAIHLPTAPKGVLMLTYAGRPLGFVKNIGNRANNMYPHEWRIRMNV